MRINFVIIIGIGESLLGMIWKFLIVANILITLGVLYLSRITITDIIEGRGRLDVEIWLLTNYLGLILLQFLPYILHRRASLWGLCAKIVAGGCSIGFWIGLMAAGSYFWLTCNQSCTPEVRIPFGILLIDYSVFVSLFFGTLFYCQIMREHQKREELYQRLLDAGYNIDRRLLERVNQLNYEDSRELIEELLAQPDPHRKGQFPLDCFRCGDRNIKMNDCVLCYENFKDNDWLAAVACCNRPMHKVCLQAALLRKACCPICRKDLIPQPIEQQHQPNPQDQAAVTVEQP